MNKRIFFLMAMLSGSALQAPPAFAQARDPIDLLPLISVRRPAAPPEATQPSVGGYVRFWIERDEGAPDGDLTDERSYAVERRHWLSRFLVGRNYARILTARLTVNRSNVVAQTVTLASAAHDSNRRQGENWTTELGERRFLTPYFRVDQGTTASIDIALSASARIDPDITRNLLSIVERGVRLAAPKVPLVTPLTATRITETADFIDSSVSRLFGEALAERSLNDFPADGWYRGSVALATIRAGFPMGTHIWGGADTRDVGTWRVYVTTPIISIFSPVELRPTTPPATVCPSASAPGNGGARKNGAPDPAELLTGLDLQACQAFTGLVPSRVLGLPVGENLTLGQALRSDTGITTALQRFGAATNANGKGEAGREVCVLVAERAETLGLNAYDGAAALWAFASNGGIPTAVSRQIWDGDCVAARLAMRLGLTLSIATATPTPTPTPTPPTPTPTPTQTPTP